MKKSHAIQFLGGTNKSAAEAIGITVQAISAWPDDLPKTISDRVEAAFHRINGRTLPPLAGTNTATAAIETVAGA